MEVNSRDNSLYIKTSRELESLLQNHFQHRKESKSLLKERLRKAELDAARLRQSVLQLSEELKTERLRCEALQTSIDDAERRHAAEVIQRDKLMAVKQSDIDAQARLLASETEKCDRRLQSLQQEKEDLLVRQKKLQSYQVSFESGIILAQRQAEADKLRAQRTKEQAEKFLEDAMASVAAANGRRRDLEHLYNTEMKRFDLEREEFLGRMHLMRQEISSITSLLSSRLAHVSVVETRASERICLSERDLSLKRDVFAIKEKEINLRHQREQQHINEEKERIHAIRETICQEYKVILEKVGLLGGECSMEEELSQLVKLKDLHKLFTSSLETSSQHSETKL